MLLSAARLRVAKLVDDVEGVVYDATEIDDALLTGQAEAWRAALSASPNIFNQTANFSSTSAGVVNLTSVRPQRLLNVSAILNGVRTSVRPVRVETAPTDYRTIVALSILYVEDVVFPAAASDFIWGHASISPSISALLDSLMISIAALELKPKENERIAGLAERKAEKEQKVLELISVPGWAVHPVDAFASRGRTAPFGYIVTSPHTLQLVT